MNPKLHTTITVALCFVAVLFSSTAVFAGNPDADYAQARAAFDRGRAGDGSASEQALDLFGKLSERDPTNPLYLAYIGGCWALRAKSARAPWNKMKYVERGLELIDRALAMLSPSHDQVVAHGVPISIETRLVAASTFLALPSLFHRFEDGKNAVAAALASPAWATSPPGVRAALQYQASLVARQDGRVNDEIKALQAVRALQPQGSSADLAQARLKEMGQ